MVLKCLMTFFITCSSKSRSYIIVQWNKDESGSEHQSNQDSDNKKPIGESNDSKLQKQASGETNVTGNILKVYKMWHRVT